jgi:hypothetical protein
VQAAYQAVHQLLILLKVDMTNVLSVTVDFSDPVRLRAASPRLLPKALP